MGLNSEDGQQKERRLDRLRRVIRDKATKACRRLRKAARYAPPLVTLAAEGLAVIHGVQLIVGK
ncbi:MULTISPECIES: hypothetical protein [Streptomyces]|uniref:hypothetical protein n=1 Tax=Streptomyces TaxID=1883 RepID=UPI0009C37C89|nr:hypothetical protein [Streptomyces sp. Sge12]ARE79452.1 hypothetical protein B6R96_36110 [Streptomyces sp. Sge12]